MNLINQQIKSNRSLNISYIHHMINRGFDFEVFTPTVASKFLVNKVIVRDYICQYMRSLNIDVDFIDENFFSESVQIARAAESGDYLPIKFLEKYFEIEQIIYHVNRGIELFKFNLDNLGEIVNLIIERFPDYCHDITNYQYPFARSILNHPKAIVEDRHLDIIEQLEDFYNSLLASRDRIISGEFYQSDVEEVLNIKHVKFNREMSKEHIEKLEAAYSSESILYAMVNSDVSIETVKKLELKYWGGNHHPNLKKYKGIINYPSWLENNIIESYILKLTRKSEINGYNSSRD